MGDPEVGCTDPSNLLVVNNSADICLLFEAGLKYSDNLFYSNCTCSRHDKTKQCRGGVAILIHLFYEILKLNCKFKWGLRKILNENGDIIICNDLNAKRRS